MEKKIELLAPGGDIDSIKAAIIAGADAIYCGLNKFNARNRAENITINNLNGILRLAHQHNCAVFITVNILVVESEIPDLIRVLNKLINTNIDGIIIQDLGLFYILNKFFRCFRIHASTQLTTHNEGQIKFLSKLNAERVNLSRELNLEEIRHLTEIAHSNNTLTEVFVHGSYCISFSGICYMSSVESGNSGNRGRCSQPCRDEYIETPTGSNFPLNLKDNSAFSNLKELSDAGVDSIKIEGRIKKFHYVYTVVDLYQRQLQNINENKPLSNDDSGLYRVFNRDFTNAYLKSNISKDMYIDNPRDNSSTHAAKLQGELTEENIEKAEREIYIEKGALRSKIKNIIDKLNIDQIPINIYVSGEKGSPLVLEIASSEKSFTIQSKVDLVDEGDLTIDSKMLHKKLKAIDDTAYYIKTINVDNLQRNLHIPFGELRAIKNRILYILNDSREFSIPVKLPALKANSKLNTTSRLSVLISSVDDIKLAKEKSVDYYYQIPGNIHQQYLGLVNLYVDNKNITPWFPSILLGRDFNAAIEFLCEVKPSQIVTNNTGVAYEASKLGIPWIAGPYLNITNSYALLNLKEECNCSGAFISNELKRQQIYRIKRPNDFKLFYSIFHPIELMTSRQCLFHQATGCHKDVMDATCIDTCKKSASITNIKGKAFIIDKSKGNFNNLFSDRHFLNTDIAFDMPNHFHNFMIDLRDIKSRTKISIDKQAVVKLFDKLIKGDAESAEQIQKIIKPTTNAQYLKGI